MTFRLFGSDLFGDEVKQPTESPLAARFLIPPFSVLDGRSGPWQERKRAWLALGIKSELGRVQVPGGGNHRTDYGGYSANFKAVGNVGSGREEKYECGAGWRDVEGLRHTSIHVPSGDSEISAQVRDQNGTGMGASIFDPVLCELAYRWFCPERGHVLDPFAGGSVRGIVAALTGREYTGIDLRREQCAANKEQAARLCPEHRPCWIVGDALEARVLTRGMEADFLFSCPPYGDLEVYSDNPRDLSTLTWSGFVMAYRKAIRASVELLKQDRFAMFVVGDFRDNAGVYRRFPDVTITAFEQAGARLYNEAILVTPAGTLPIRTAIPFTTSRKLGKSHQNVLVFVKGDPQKAAEACERSVPSSQLPLRGPGKDEEGVA